MLGRMVPPTYSVPPALPIAGLGKMTPWGDVQRYHESVWAPDELMRGRMEVLARERMMLGLGFGPGDVLGSFGSAALSQVARIDVESQVSPTYSYDPNAPAAPPSQGDNVLMRQVVKPRVTFYDRSGRTIARYAPYGDPTPGLFVPIEVGVGVVAGLLLGRAIYRAIKPARVQNPPKKRRGRWRRYHARRARSRA